MNDAFFPFIQQFIQFCKENYSFKEIIHSFEKMDYRPGLTYLPLLVWKKSKLIGFQISDPLISDIHSKVYDLGRFSLRPAFHFDS